MRDLRIDCWAAARARERVKESEEVIGVICLMQHDFGNRELE